jgi:hypothetical protein
MSSAPYQSIDRARHVLPLLLAVALYTTPPRRGEAEESIDFKMMHYQEAGGRIGVTSPAFGIRIDGVFNTITGASPTGAPPVPVYETVSRTVATGGGGAPVVGGDEREDEDEDEDEFEDEDNALNRVYHTFAAATPTGGGGGGGSTTITEQVPTGAVEVPLAEVEDERWGVNLEVVKKVANHSLSSKISFSTESDYDSYALALSDGIAFNDRSTILLMGGAYTYDTISLFTTGGTDTKVSTDVMLGITQLLNAKTRVQANLTLGRISGYMNDPYKVAELNGVLVPEARPDEKSKTIAYFALARYLQSLRASIEGSYRWYNDDFGVTGHTASLAWFQELGDHWIIRPRVRLYRQNAADFYAVRFSGDPQFYSSDYRVSELETFSAGLKLIWRPSDRFAFDIGFDRYEQQGTDGVTSQEFYPVADVYTGGVRIWL